MWVELLERPEWATSQSSLGTAARLSVTSSGRYGTPHVSSPKEVCRGALTRFDGCQAICKYAAIVPDSRRWRMLMRDALRAIMHAR
eukprot:scaffold3801_cov124-Isochrysis_galbana.AAC.10